MKIWVPSPDIAAVVSNLPDGLPRLNCSIYTGADPLPDAPEEVEIWVPPLIPVPNLGDLLPRMGNLRLLQTVTAGVEPYLPHLPMGAVLCNARGVHDPGTAEWVVAAMLSVVREFSGFTVAQARHEWAYHHTGVLAGSTVLIVGYGSIGAAVERRLAGFDVEIIRVARTARPGVHGHDELPTLLPAADVVVLLVPATPETAGMVDAEFLAAMKDGALLVNAARGSVVDTDALLTELRQHRLRAALDVAPVEPLPPEHPLWSAPGLFLTPHVAGSTPLSVQRARDLVRDQIIRYLTGADLANMIISRY